MLLFSAQALAMAIRCHRARPYDICLAWSTLPAGAVALVLRLVTGLLYTVWVSGPDIPGFERRYRFIYPVLSPVIRMVWRRAASVIAKCAGEVEMIHLLEPAVDPVFIPNGVDLRNFKRKAEIPESGPLHVVCVARLIERKGQDHLIEAMKRLKDEGRDVVLTLVGTGDMHAHYQDLARKLGVQDRVRFAGYVPREEINECYEKAHVFALPSFNEGMSLAALEAMAASLPLIVTRTGGTEELLEDGTNGFVFEWGDVERLTDHLRVFLNDRRLVNSMGSASRARAARFSWDVIAARFLELFNKAIPKSSKSTPSFGIQPSRNPF
jgi:glycosyltransferase involved in cell wall biosynthesis